MPLTAQILLLALAASSSLHAADRTPTQDGLVYGEASGEKLTMDYYAPKGAGVHPIAIIIHGGGYQRGDSKSGSEAYCADFLAPAGYAVFSINYRLAPKYPYPDMVHDVERAVRYLRHNAAFWRADPNKIALVGGSAGGFLSNMVGLLQAPGNPTSADPVDRESASVQAVVTLYAQSSFSTVPLNNDVHALLDPLIQKEGEATALRDASPITYVTKNAPPFLLIQGDQDEYIPYSEDTNLQNALRRVGVRCDIIRIPGGKHGTGGWDKLPGVPDWEREMVEWLNARLNHQGPVGEGIRARTHPQAALKPSADLVITHAYAVTMNQSKTIYADGAIVINNGSIIAIGPASLAGSYSARQLLDAAGDIALPGMINAHTHASMTVFRGLGDDVPDRLQRFIFPLEHKLVDREIVYWGALWGMIEMIEGGVTTMADMYYFEDEVARGAHQIGMRGILGETVLNAPAPDAQEPYGGITYARNFIHSLRGDPLLTPAFAPHAPYTVDADHLRQIQKEADAENVPILMHVAEMPNEVTDTRRDFNKTPLEYLDSIGLLTSRLTAAHCIFVTDSDVALLKSRHVGVSHNMVANIKSAKGVSPAWKMFNDGVRIGLGTDGPMSGNTLDILGQLGYVAKVQKLANHDRNIMPAIDVVEMATMGGARALHMEHQVGSLETGKLADIILLDHNATTLTPFYDVYSSLVYSAAASTVKTTIIQGRIIMRDRQIKTIDVSDVRDHMQSLGRKITSAIANGIN